MSCGLCPFLWAVVISKAIISSRRYCNLGDEMRRTTASFLMLLVLSIVISSSLRRAAGVSGEYYCYDFHVIVTPESPTTQDEVSINVSTWSPCCNHDFNFSSLSQDGNSFSTTIEIYAPPICLTEIEYHEQAYSLGKLSAGSYFCWNVTAIDAHWNYIEEYRSSCSKPFTVKGYMQLTVMTSPFAAIPFTINGQAELTPYQDLLVQDSYVLEMPTAHNGYDWSHWLEDGDPNRTKTIMLDSNATWTAVYEPVEPSPPSPPIGGTTLSIETGYFSSWLASTLLIVAFVFASSIHFKRKYVRAER